jgi:hypothetical protein
MTFDSDRSEDDQIFSSSDDELAAEDAPNLPPVEPPSAGFIVQLFLIPALIVSVILGVYLLFGQLAEADLDWRQQVVDVGSDNPHVRWRGAQALAQMLDADAQRGDRSQHLARNPEIAAALVELFEETLDESPRDEEVMLQLEFMTKALGRLDVPDIVLPVLLEVAIEQQDPPELQKHALTGIAMLVGRAFEQGRPVDDPQLVRRMISVSDSGNPLARHQATFILGLLDSPASTEQLERLLGDSDLMTRTNAAIGLTRADSLDGLPVFEEVLQDAASDPLTGAIPTSELDAEVEFERKLLLSNSLNAIEQLRDQFNSRERARIAGLVDQVAETTGDEEMRVQARELGRRLQAGG